MENISIHRVTADAPAAAPRRSAEAEGLVDTAKFLRHVRERFGMVPVLAIQGSPHIDAGENAPPEAGRHLVVAATPGGTAVVLLNSHSKDRRAHLGFGAARDGLALIGPSAPIQRWKGYEDEIKALYADPEAGAQLDMAVGALLRMKATPGQQMSLARAMSRGGYLASVEARPKPESLVEGFVGSSMLDLGFHVLGRMRSGNLESSVRGGRRIKRVRRPDGLFHAGMICFDHMLTEAVKSRKISSRVTFGPVGERLVRP